MKPNRPTSIEAWRATSKLSVLRFPATFALAAVGVLALNIVLGGNRELSVGAVRVEMSDAFYVAASVLLSTLPVWYYITSARLRERQVPAASVQLLLCAIIFLLTLLLMPRFEIQYRDYDFRSEHERKDFTTTWIKRSFFETLRLPQLSHDELTWLQSNYSAAYIPAQIYCPRRRTRLFPFFGVIDDDHLANALAPEVGASDSAKPPAAALENAFARCKREGAAMLAGGFTKESALMRGDVDRFFSLATAGAEPEKELVLEDDHIPPGIRAKIDDVLRSGDTFNYLQNPNYDIKQGEVRRLNPLVVAVALERTGDAERLGRDKR